MRVSETFAMADLKNRLHSPPANNFQTLADLCRQHGIPYPVTTTNPIRFEVTGVADETHYRNHPDRTYTLNLKSADPCLVIEILAYCAFEWEAREVAKKLP